LAGEVVALQASQVSNYEPQRLSFDQLAERARTLIRPGQRHLLGITGAPGAGKSTLSAALMDALGDAAVLVGMDGFHLADQELTRLGRRDRKGAPDTFDVDGYVALLARLRQQRTPTIYAPVFNRGIEEPIGSAIPVFRVTPLVVTEGNYLLLNRFGWHAVRPLLDEVWFLDIDPGLRSNRLVLRRQRFGHSVADAQQWVRDVDARNAEVIDATRGRADLLVHLTTTLGSTPGSAPGTASSIRERPEHGVVE
jgi:pantothenate kinase